MSSLANYFVNTLKFKTFNLIYFSFIKRVVYEKWILIFFTHNSFIYMLYYGFLFFKFLRESYRNMIKNF